MPDSSQSLRAVPTETFAERLRSRRIEEHMSQSDLGDHLKTRQQTIAAWEHGQRPQRRFFDELAVFLRVPGGVAALEDLLNFSAPTQGVAPAPAPRVALSADAARRAALIRVVEGYAGRIERGGELSVRDMDLFERALSALTNL